MYKLLGQGTTSLEATQSPSAFEGGDKRREGDESRTMLWLVAVVSVAIKNHHYTWRTVVMFRLYPSPMCIPSNISH